jgi:hypothetical protein
VISLDLPSTATSPKVRLASVAQALTRCNGPNTDEAEPQSVLPSMAMWFTPTNSLAARSHSRQQRVKARGSSWTNTRRKVSCDGMPLGNGKNRLNQAFRFSAKSSMSSQSSQLPITPQMAMTMMYAASDPQRVDL